MTLGAALYWSALRPTHEGVWQSLQSRLPIVTIDQGENGDIYRIDNLRDFRYHPDGAIATPQYFSAQYQPADLQQVWLGISHFGGYGFAHTFLSFEFSEQLFLVASVEARLRADQSYNPLFGLVRQYNKLVVLGSEADVIGLRSHIRSERVLLYPLTLSKEQMQYLFRAVMVDAQQLSMRPSFYNTLLDNCTTNLLKHDPDYHVYNSLIDYRLLLPGYSDAVVQERGWMPDGASLESLRQRATVVVTEKVGLDAEGFSQAIRRGWQVQTASAVDVSPNK